MTDRPTSVYSVSPGRLVAIGAGAALLYAGIGVLLIQPGTWVVAPAMLFFPPSGIIFGILYLFGRRLWPAATLGAITLTVFTGGAAEHVLATAIGNTLEPLVAIELLRRAGFDRGRGAVRDVGVLAMAAMAGCFVSAVFGTIGIALTDPRSALGLGQVLAMWTAGHGLGALLVGSPLILLSHVEREPRCGPDVEPWIAISALTLVSQLVFSGVPGEAGSYPLQYLTYPFLIWVALRMTWFWLTLANFLVSGSALVWAAAGVGPFFQGDTPNSLFYGSIFATVTWLTTMILMASVYARRRSERSRRLRETAYHAVVRGAIESIFVLNDEGVCTEANAAVARLFHRHPDEVIGTQLVEWLPPRDRQAFVSAVESMSPGATRLVEWSLPFGKETIEVEASVKRFEDGTLHVLARDVTERRSLERQLNQSQKMEAVGLLAGGVAHDFNNQLTVIVGQAYLGLDLLPTDHEAQRSLEEIVRAANRSSELTEQLLTLARRRRGDPRAIDLDQLLAENLEVIRRVLGEDIKYRRVQKSGTLPPTIFIDPSNLEQVILNLVLNAKDAMPRGGRLTIATEVVAPPEQGAGDNQGTVILRVQDNGLGMSSETADRLFEPFYTTKAGLSRTGLGLSVSYGLIEGAGGSIDFETKEGVGTSFRIRLPRIAQSPAGSATPAKHPPRASGERILVIEDDDAVRRFVELALEKVGYRVVAVADGAAAVATTNAGSDFDLILTDVILPDRSGPEVAAEITRNRADIPVLFMSGYDENRIANAGHAPERLIRKPFTILGLAEAISRALATDGVPAVSGGDEGPAD